MSEWADEDDAVEVLRAMLVERYVPSFRETTERYETAHRAAEAFPFAPVVLATAAALIARQSPRRFINEARAMGDRALALDASDDFVRFLVALVEQEAGDFDRAIELLMRNIEDGGDVNDYGEAANAMSCCDRHPEAIELLMSSPFAGEAVIVKQIQDLRDELRVIQEDREAEARIREHDRELGLE